MSVWLINGNGFNWIRYDCKEPLVCPNIDILQYEKNRESVTA